VATQRCRLEQRGATTRVQVAAHGSVHRQQVMQFELAIRTAHRGGVAGLLAPPRGVGELDLAGDRENIRCAPRQDRVQRIRRQTHVAVEQIHPGLVDTRQQARDGAVETESARAETPTHVGEAHHQCAIVRLGSAIHQHMDLMPRLDAATRQRQCRERAGQQIRAAALGNQYAECGVHQTVPAAINAKPSSRTSLPCPSACGLPAPRHSNSMSTSRLPAGPNGTRSSIASGASHACR